MPDDQTRLERTLWTPGRIIATAVVGSAIAAGGFVLFSSGPGHSESKFTSRVVLPGSAESSPGDSVVPEDYEIPTLDGRQIKLSDYRGKVLVVDFWATWCPPCRQEIPQLVRIANEKRERGVEVVGLHIEDPRNQPPEAIRKFMSDFSISYTVAMATSRLFTDYLGVEETAIPQTLVFDRRGRVVGHFIGYGPNDARDLELAVNRAIASS